MIGMADSPYHFSIFQNIFRQCHPHIAGVSQMMQIRPGHLAHERDLSDRGGICPFLGGADGRERQFPQLVRAGHQSADVFRRDPRNGARRRIRKSWITGA